MYVNVYTIHCIVFECKIKVFILFSYLDYQQKEIGKKRIKGINIKHRNLLFTTFQEDFFVIMKTTLPWRDTFPQLTVAEVFFNMFL